MGGFTKLFGSIVHSTIWQEDHPTRVLWVTMLALADQNGFVSATVPGLANAARITLGECERALYKFQQPDSYSRSTAAEGRRISAVNGGWQLINYGAYRKAMSIEDQREKARIRQQNKRERDRHASVTLCHAPVTPGHGCHDIAEAEAEAEEKVSVFPYSSGAVNGVTVPDEPGKPKPIFSPFVEESQKQTQTPGDQPPLNLARGLAEKLQLHSGLLYVIEEAIRLAATKKATNFAGAFDYLFEMAVKARENGKAVNRFWFQDGDNWEPKEPKPKARKRAPPPPDGVALKRAQLQAARERGEIE